MSISISLHIVYLFGPIFAHLGVYYYLHIHRLLLLQPLDGSQRDPQIVGVEDLEL